eukprot:1939974-Pyramimonas_sp.AAC.1
MGRVGRALGRGGLTVARGGSLRACVTAGACAHRVFPRRRFAGASSILEDRIFCGCLWPFFGLRRSLWGPSGASPFPAPLHDRGGSEGALMWDHSGAI